jgi:O-methyltransferase
MLKRIKKNVVELANKLGYDVAPLRPAFPADEQDIMDKVRPFTMTSNDQLSSLINAVEYLIVNQVQGDFVECGVWRGGSMMAAALALLKLGQTSRHFYLFDTYEGMSSPTDEDTALQGGRKAKELLAEAKNRQDAPIWAHAGLEDVQRNMESTRYPSERIHYVKGKVEDTLPQQIPGQIALLRLDTDWYESTRHELVHLYPKLAPNGILILDDYGHWAGARKATDEYFAQFNFRPLLNRLDYTARLLIKPAS